MEIQSSVLYTMPKNSSKFENHSPIQRQSPHHLQHNNETQKHDELCKNN